MPYIIRLARECPYCMSMHRDLLLTLAFPYLFRLNFKFSGDYVEMSEISPGEPLIYHPATNTYIEGAPADPILIRELIAFLIEYDIDKTYDKFHTYPVPEPIKLVDNVIEKTNKSVYNMLKEKYAEAVLETKESVWKSEQKALERISTLLEKI